MKAENFDVVELARKVARSRMAFYNKMMNEKTMSKLKIVKGNLIDLAEQGEFDIIVQGCNCFNIMGGGIAREIRSRYPGAAMVDRYTTAGDYQKLGTWTEFITSVDEGDFTIVNAYTQFNTSSGEDVFEYTAFKLILQKLAHIYPKERFGFPKIGMGLAGGDEQRIMAMLEEFANTVADSGGSVTLVEFQ